MHSNLFAIAFLLNSVLLVLPTRVVQAQVQPDLKTQIESIQSVAEIKAEIKQSLMALDHCGNGMCQTLYRFRICEEVGRLDIRVDGKIFSGMQGWTPSVLPISKSDLNLMKLIFRQCKPSNYDAGGYRNRFNSVMRVVYDPTPSADQIIRRQLGIPLQKR